MRELVNFIIVDAARQQGKDTTAASNMYKKTFPRYGDPSKWNPSEKFNIGLTKNDSEIYPEFASRVDAWRKKHSQNEIDDFINQHGTLNAVIRMQIAVGAL
jgi:hypothetical protein